MRTDWRLLRPVKLGSRRKSAQRLDRRSQTSFAFKLRDFSSTPSLSRFHYKNIFVSALKRSSVEVTIFFLVGQHKARGQLFISETSTH